MCAIFAGYETMIFHFDNTSSDSLSFTGYRRHVTCRSFGSFLSQMPVALSRA
jgi:hypothetical protein